MTSSSCAHHAAPPRKALVIAPPKAPPPPLPPWTGDADGTGAAAAERYSVPWRWVCPSPSDTARYLSMCACAPWRERRGGTPHTPRKRGRGSG